MATRKKTKKKSTATKKGPGSKPPSKRPAPKRPTSGKSTKKKVVKKKAVAMKKAPVKKAARRAGSLVGTRNRIERRRPRSSASASEVSGLESGDLQGLSNVESADSESVDELLEEGNAFEAGIVAGVEESGDHEGEEVRTHEMPEDDVPEEYLDEE